MKKNNMVLLIFIFTILFSSIVFAADYSVSLNNATQWLTQQQKIDGSWGEGEDVMSLYT